MSRHDSHFRWGSVPRDLDRGLTWWARIGVGRVLGAQAVAGLPGTVALAAGLLPAVAGDLAAALARGGAGLTGLAIGSAAGVFVELGAQGAAGAWMGGRGAALASDLDRGAGHPLNLARRGLAFAGGVAAAALPLLLAGAALAGAVVAAAPPAAVGAAGVVVVAAFGWGLVATGRAALGAVAVPAAAAETAPRRALAAATAAQLALFGASAAAAASAVGVLAGFAEPSLAPDASMAAQADPSRELSSLELRALVRAQVLQLMAVRAGWMFTAAWAWCTWIAVARGAAPARRASDG